MCQPKSKSCVFDVLWQQVENIRAATKKDKRQELLGRINQTIVASPSKKDKQRLRSLRRQLKAAPSNKKSGLDIVRAARQKVNQALEGIKNRRANPSWDKEVAHDLAAAKRLIDSLTPSQRASVSIEALSAYKQFYKYVCEGQRSARKRDKRSRVNVVQVV